MSVKNLLDKLVHVSFDFYGAEIVRAYPCSRCSIFDQPFSIQPTEPTGCVQLNTTRSCRGREEPTAPPTVV